MKNIPVHVESFKEFTKNFGKLKKPCVIFVGPPGCGKGTQAEILSKKTKWTHISTGEILRKSKDKEVKELMKSGKLLPDELVANVLEDFLKKSKGSKGFIFDGYPRNLFQKNLFDGILKTNGIEIVNTFFINVPEKILRERITERGRTSGRSDDKDPKVFKIRMNEYRDQTLPMINAMKIDENFIEIPGRLKLEDISKKIEKIILKKSNEI